MKATLILKQAGKLVPVEFLKKVLHEANPTCFGIAAHTKDSAGLLLNHWPALQDIGGEMGEVAAAIDELQTELKDGTMLLSFNDKAGKVTAVEDGYDTPEMMPYPLIYDPEGQVHLILAAQGDFSAWAQKDTDTPDVVFAIKDDLMGRLGEIFDEAEGDLAKVMARLRKSTTFQKDIKKLSTGDSGVFTLFASDGDILTVSQNDKTILMNDWGWTTHQPLASVPQVKPEEKKKGLTLGLFKPKAQETPKPAPVENVPAAAPLTPAPAPQTETAPAPAVKVELLQCPSTIVNKKDIKQWYIQHCGYPPQNYKNRPKVECRLPLKDFKDLQKVAAIENGSAKEEPKPLPEGVHVVSEKPKDTTPHEVKPEMAKPVEKKIAGIVPAEQKEKMMKDGVVLKMVGRSSEIINSIEKIKAEEGKTPSFSEQLPKIGLQGLLAATDADYDHLILSYPDAIKAILMAYRSQHLKLMDMEHKAAPKKEEAKPAPAPAVAPAAANTNAGKPKLSLGGFKKVA